MQHVAKVCDEFEWSDWIENCRQSEQDGKMAVRVYTEIAIFVLDRLV